MAGHEGTVAQIDQPVSGDRLTCCTFDHHRRWFYDPADVRALEPLGLQVLTNSLHIVSALLPQPQTRVSLPAGTLFREQNIVLSASEEDGTGHYQASKMFMGAAAVGKPGLMQRDIILLQAERRLIARARSVILLVDSSKFRAPAAAVVCPLGDISTVITDAGIADADARLIKRAGAALVVVAGGG